MRFDHFIMQGGDVLCVFSSLFFVHRKANIPFFSTLGAAKILFQITPTGLPSCMPNK